MGQTTITVDEITLERFNQVKSTVEHGDDDLSADQFLNVLLDTWQYAQNNGTTER